MESRFTAEEFTDALPKYHRTIKGYDYIMTDIKEDRFTIIFDGNYSTTYTMSSIANRCPANADISDYVETFMKMLTFLS